MYVWDSKLKKSFLARVSCQIFIIFFAYQKKKICRTLFQLLFNFLQKIYFEFLHLNLRKDPNKKASTESDSLKSDSKKNCLENSKITCNINGLYIIRHLDLASSECSCPIFFFASDFI